MLLTLDKVKYKHRGTYNPTVTYQFNDAVLFGGSSYSALKDVTGKAPLISKGIANNTRFVVTHTQATPTTGGYRFAQTSSTPSIYDVSATTDNPTLNLIRGNTYFFDCNSLTQPQALCLVRNLSEISATPKVTSVAGALRNNIWVGMWSGSKEYNTIENAATTQRKPLTTANRVITFHVPLYSNTSTDNTVYYTSAPTAGATYGTILLWDSRDKVLNSDSWAVIVKSSDETSDNWGSLPFYTSSGAGLLAPGFDEAKLMPTSTAPRTYVLNNYGPSGGIIVNVPGARHTPTFTSDKVVTNTTGQFFEIAPVKWAGTDADPTRTWAQSSLQSTALLKYDRDRVGEGFQNTKDIIAQGNSSTATSAAALASAFGEATPNSFTITNSGSGAYTYNSVSNPNLYLVRGQTYQITVSAIGHPFWIQSIPALASSTQPTAYDAGITYNTGVENNGAQNGVIKFTVPLDCPQLRYVCQNHSAMRGRIVVMDAVYTDWYLPSRDEFAQLLNNNQMATVGIDSALPYWISQQSTTANADALKFNFSGTVGTATELKSATLSVRPIRKFFATGTPTDLTWNTNFLTSPVGSSHTEGGRQFNSGTPFPLTTENVGRLPLQTDTPAASSLMSRTGFDPGRGPGFWISPDRRSLKSAGYQYYNCLGYNAHASEYDDGSTYPGNRYNMTLQYCQFDSVFADDEWIKFVRRNDSSAVVVTNRGRVYFTGYNGYGQFGLNHSVTTRVFTRNFEFGDTEGKTVTDAWINKTSDGTTSMTGSTHLLTLEGELYAAGYNGYGQLGDGTGTTRSNFVRIGETTLNKNGTKIRGAFSNEVNTYDSGGIAWTELNEIYGWGYNDSGWLAQNNVSAYNAPVRMTQLENIMGNGVYPVEWAVLCSNTNTQTSRNMWAVLSSDGHIYTAGRSSQGQHGYGIADSSSIYTYAQVTRPAGKVWRKLYGGGGETGTFYGITTDNNLYAWGYNGYGQLGNGNTTSSPIPILASAMPTGFAGNVDRIWVTGHNNHCLVWVKTFNNRYCTFGYNSQHLGMRAEEIPSLTWNTTSHPIEVTNYLPYSGRGIITINPYHYQSSSNNGTMAVEYDTGEIFTWGGTQSRGENPASGDGSVSSQGSNFQRSHCQLVTTFWF